MDIVIALICFVAGAALINLLKYYLVKWLDTMPAYFTSNTRTSDTKCLKADDTFDLSVEGERVELKPTKAEDGQTMDEILSFVMDWLGNMAFHMIIPC